MECCQQHIVVTIIKDVKAKDIIILIIIIIIMIFYNLNPTWLLSSVHNSIYTPMYQDHVS